MNERLRRRGRKTKDKSRYFSQLGIYDPNTSQSLSNYIINLSSILVGSHQQVNCVLPPNHRQREKKPFSWLHIPMDKHPISLPADSHSSFPFSLEPTIPIRLLCPWIPWKLLLLKSPMTSTLNYPTDREWGRRFLNSSPQPPYEAGNSFKAIWVKSIRDNFYYM